MLTFKRGMGTPGRAFVFGTVSILSLAIAGSSKAGTINFNFHTNLGSATESSLFLFGAAGTEASVVNDNGFSQNVILGPDGFFNLPIPLTQQMSGTGINNRGFRVVSADNLAGYFLNRRDATTDISYLFEQSNLGTDYVVASQGQGFGEGSQVSITATQDNTNVTFTPVGSAPVNVVLQENETYKYAGGNVNLTGSTVTSDAPIAVFSGHACAEIPSGVFACDHLYEQMPSTDVLSSSYIVGETTNTGSAGNLIRVVGASDNTEVTVDGVVAGTIDRGEFLEFPLTTGAALIETSEPALVAQYLQGTGTTGVLGDPALTFIPGQDTWLDGYNLAAPSDAAEFADNFVNIVISTADLASLTLDGIPVEPLLFTVFGGTGFSYGNIEVQPGLYSLAADSAFQVTLFGFDSADSYLSFGGATFAPGISPPPPPPPGPPAPPPPNTIPEPGTMALLGTGLAAMGLHRRRSRGRSRLLLDDDE